MSYLGTTTDRAGREGLVWGFTSRDTGLPTKYIYTIDATTRQVTGMEEMLTKTPGKLNVSIPAVIS